MNNEFLIGMNTIPCYPFGTIHVLTLRKGNNIYCDFYKVSGRKVIFIDHIELDEFCYRIGHQLINNIFIIYRYDILPGKKRQIVTELYKYYDIKDDISINYSVGEALEKLGFGLAESDKKIYKSDSDREKRLEEYIDYLEKISDEINIIPLVDGSNLKRKYKSRRAYRDKLLNPMNRDDFTKYITQLITCSDEKLKVNKKVIDLHDYFDGKKY